MTSPRLPSMRMSTATVAASLGTCTSGVSCAYNGAQLVIEKFVNQSFYDHYGVALSDSALDALWGALCAQTDLGAVFGSLLINRLSEKYGRNRTGLLINCIIIIFGSILQSLAMGFGAFELLFLGRFVCGFSLGLSCIVPIYMAECSLDGHRGFVGTLSTLCWYLWDPISLFLAQSFMLGTEELWPYLVGFTAIPAAAAIFVGRIIPECPKYLHISRGHKEKAVEALYFYHGNCTFSQITYVHSIEELLFGKQLQRTAFEPEPILQEYEQEHHLAKSQPDASLRTIFSEPHFRRAFFISLMVILSLDIVGSDFVSQYSTRPNLAVLAALLSTIPGIIAAGFTLSFIERIGRRPLMLVAMATGAVANLLLTISVSTYPKLAVLGVVLIKVCHDGGAAPVGHFIPGEVCPQATRSKTATVAWTLNWSFSSVVVLFFPILQSCIGSYTYLIFFVGCMVFLAWFYRFMPETNQKGVDEIVEQWLPLVSNEKMQ